MPSDSNPSAFVIPGPVPTQTATTVVPQSVEQGSMTNLANGQAIAFEFNIDTSPIFDAFVFADQAITLNVYLRQSPADTYRLLNNTAFATGTANVLKQLMTGTRLAGSQAKIEFANGSGVDTTAFSAQVHSRSL